MKIEGRITQIIQPNEINGMMVNREGLPIRDFANTHYILVIFKSDFPKNYFKRIWYAIKHRKERYTWDVVKKECDNKEGDSIELNIEPYYKKTNLFIEKEGG